MKKMIRIVAAAALAVGAVSTARADEVFTNVGDQLSGTIKSVDGGKMTFHSDTVGDVEIPMAKVRTFSTSGPIEIHLADGTVIQRQVKSAGPGEVALAAGGIVPAQTVPLTAVDQINPAVFFGTLRLGGTLTRGNTNTETLAAGFNLGVNVNRHDRIDFAGEYDYGRQKTKGVATTTVDHWTLDAKYDHFFSQKFYGYIEAEVAKDRIASLDLRFTPSAGVGYQWYDTSPFKFATEGGIAWLYERYTNGTPTVEDVALKLSYHLTYDFNEKVSLFNNVTYIPSLQNGNRFLLLTDLGLHAKLNDKLFMELKAEWDHNNAPANGAQQNDTRLIASVGYTL